MSHCVSQLIVRNNLWQCGWRRLDREQLECTFRTLDRWNSLSWKSLLLAPLYQACFSPSCHNSWLVIFPLSHINDMFLLSYPFHHPHELEPLTLKMLAVLSPERSEKLGQIFTNVLYFLYWVRVSHFRSSITELTYNCIFLHFTKAAIFSRTFEECGCIGLINIHMSGDTLQLCVWIPCDNSHVACSHYVNVDLVFDNCLRRWPCNMTANKGAVDVSCAGGRTEKS